MKWMYLKKTLATVLTVALLAGAVGGLPVQAAETTKLGAMEQMVSKGAAASSSGECGTSASYTLVDGVLTISGTGAASHISGLDDVKKIVVEEGITTIPNFMELENLQEVQLPGTVTELGYFSFEKCPVLTKIVAPGVEKIRNFSFSGCTNLREYKFADQVEITWRAFEGCEALADESGCIVVNGVLCGFDQKKSGNTLIIPEGVTTVVEGALAYTGVNWTSAQLTSISIPSTLFGPDNNSFSGIGGSGKGLVRELLRVDTLESITVAENNPWYSVVDGCLLNKDKTKLLICPNGKKGDYEVPNTVETIGYAALSRCAYMTKVTIPEAVKYTETLGCATQNQAPMYFKGNAPEYVDQNPSNPGKNIFYDDYYDTEDYDKWMATAAPSEWHTKNLEQLDRIAKWEIYYAEGTTGWDALKAEHPKMKNWICSDPKSLGIVKNIAKVTLNKDSVTYTGKAQTPAITVTDANGQTVDAANYTVTYTNNKKVGQAAVTVTGKGIYNGTITETFNIVPKGTTLSKVTAKKKAFTAKWKKQNKETTGYQIQYATSKNFKGAKIKTIKKNKTTSLTIKNLKAGKKYYVRIRTYKTVKVNGKSQKLYSEWSKSQNVKVKNN